MSSTPDADRASTFWAARPPKRHTLGVLRPSKSPAEPPPAPPLISGCGAKPAAALRDHGVDDAASLLAGKRAGITSQPERCNHTFLARTQSLGIQPDLHEPALVEQPAGRLVPGLGPVALALDHRTGPQAA